MSRHSSSSYQMLTAPRQDRRNLSPPLRLMYAPHSATLRSIRRTLGSRNAPSRNRATHLAIISIA